VKLDVSCLQPLGRQGYVEHKQLDKLKVLVAGQRQGLLLAAYHRFALLQSRVHALGSLCGVHPVLDAL